MKDKINSITFTWNVEVDDNKISKFLGTKYQLRDKDYKIIKEISSGELVNILNKYYNEG